MVARVALLCLCACAGQAPPARTPMTWTMYQNGLTHNAVLRIPFPGVSWYHSLNSKINGGLAFDGKRLFAVDFRGELVAVDPYDGHVLWRAHADDVLMSTPIVADGMVFVGSGTNAVLWEKKESAAWGRPAGNHWYAFRADNGQMVWSRHVAGEAMPTAAYVDGELIFATGDNMATAVDARTGVVRWQTPLPGVPTMVSAMVDGGKVFLAATQGKPQYLSPTRSHTLALDVRTGKILWSAPYGNGDCAPTVANGMIFVEGENDGPSGNREAIGNNDVDALDERTGALRWQYQSGTGFFADIGSNERAIAGTYADGVLYQSLPAMSAMAAFRAADGKLLWLTRTSGPVKMSPLVYEGSLYFGDTSGMLYRLDAKTGAVRSAQPFDRPFTTSPPLIVGRTLFIAGTDFLHAFPLRKL